MVLSENDKLVDTQISYEMAHILGAKQDSFSVYNQYSVLEKERKSHFLPWIVVLPEGGHYSFVNHPKVVNGEIMSFLEKLKESSSNSCQEKDTTQPKRLYPDVTALPVPKSR